MMSHSEVPPFAPQELARRLLLGSDGSTDSDPSGFELNAETGSAIAIVIVLSALANSVGVAGGFFWIPLFNALLGFGLTGSAALSQALIACGTAGATAYSLLHRHPWDSSRPLIDYSLAVVLMPAMILGITVGSLLNLILPALILVCILFVILVAVSVRTFQQGLKERAAERALRDALAAENDRANDSLTGIEEARTTRPVPNGMVSNEVVNIEEDENYPLDENAPGQKLPGAIVHGQMEQKKLEQGRVKRKDSGWHKPLLPWTSLLEILSVFVVFLSLQIGKSFYGRCEWQFILMFCFQGLVVVGASVSFIWLKEHPVPVQRGHSRYPGRANSSQPVEYCTSLSHRRTDGNSNGHAEDAPTSDTVENAPEIEASDESDIVNSHESTIEIIDEAIPEIPASWNVWRLALVWVVTMTVGVISGTVGLGGGVLIAPLMIELKVHPQSAAATSTFIVLFASTVAAVAFALDGKLNLVYTAVYGPMSLLGGFIGAFVIIGIVRRWHIASLVLFMLAALVACAAGLVIGFAGRHAVTDVINGKPIEVADICEL